MNKQYISTILAITSLAFSTGAMAENMSKNEYKAAEKSIATEYKSAKAGCNTFADNARDICMVVAKGREKVAKAGLMRAKSDAESQLKTSEAIEKDNDKTIDAHLKTKEDSEQARGESA